MIRWVSGCVVLTLALIMMWGCVSDRPAHDMTKEAETRLRCLDTVAAAHMEYKSRKEAIIASKTRRFYRADMSVRRVIMRELYSEYFNYDLDSAVHYGRMVLEDAENTNAGDEAAFMRIALARMEFLRGNIWEGREYMSQAACDTVNASVLTAYVDAMVLYSELMEQDMVPWLERLCELTDSTSVQGIYSRSNLLREEGYMHDALQLLYGDNPALEANPHMRAVTYYMRGRLQLEMGDSIAAVESLTQSATNDLITPVRDYKSLYELASLLLALGDTDRAYRYINIALEDVNSAKTASNKDAVSEIMPVIVKAHELREAQRRRSSRSVMIAVGVLAVMSVLALVFVWRSRRRLIEASIREKALIRELNEACENLSILNRSLSESNEVKEAYLVQYFDLCSNYVDSLHRFVDSVAATLRTKGLPGIERLLATTDPDRQLKEFYANFDDTFLRIFPNFINELNKLLRCDAQVSLNRDGSMSNELRVMALIRLGITDSDRMAQFLRRSLPTIYNYRVKMRNSAAGNRESFEDRVGNLCL